MSMKEPKQMKVGGTRKIALDTICFVIILILFILFMFPFLMVLLNSLKTKVNIIKDPFSFNFAGGLAIGNYQRAFSKMNYIRSFGNSMFVTSFSTFFTVLLSSMLAYYLVRHVNKFSKIISIAIVASMIIPFQALMIPLVSIYGANLNVLNHRPTLIFMHTGFSIALSTFIYQGFIKSEVPVALEEGRR